MAQDRSHSTSHLSFSHQHLVLTFSELPVFPCSCSRLRNNSPSLCPHFVKWRNSPPQDSLCNRIIKSYRKTLGKARDGRSLKGLLKRQRQQPPAWQVSEPGWWLGSFISENVLEECVFSGLSICQRQDMWVDEFCFWTYVVGSVLSV